MSGYFLLHIHVYVLVGKEFNNTSISSGSTEQTSSSLFSAAFDSRVLVIGSEACQTEVKVSEFLASLSYNVINLQDPVTQEWHFDETYIKKWDHLKIILRLGI